MTARDEFRNRHSTGALSPRIPSSGALGLAVAVVAVALLAPALLLRAPRLRNGLWQTVDCEPWLLPQRHLPRGLQLPPLF